MLDTQIATITVTSTDSDFATFGAIALDVTDGERALGFWRDLIGLELLSRDGDDLHLGVAGRDLVILRPGARGPVLREASGLYHVSFHLPALEDFAHAFARLEAAGYFQFPNDHGGHLANYVDDPDGIGLEFAFESPPELRATWERTPGFEPGDDGSGHWTPGDPRYFAWLRSHVADGAIRPTLPAGTIIGHMHLRAGDLDAALAYYRDAIGFTPNGDDRPKGFFDMSAGGTFSHRLACNDWESAGRPQRPADAAGMRYFALQHRSAEELAAAIARAESAGSPIERHPDGALVTAPDGTQLLLAGLRAVGYQE
jgi:catechol 2,3-dioxygenase